MTNETRKRIEAYEKMLPDMKERIAAVAILLVMSISMMISASFAWLTISRNPEVASVSTTVAANGNLEIALATGDVNSAQAPDESKIGDSSATKGQSVVGSNITWGNLVNLSDPSYGLDHLTLRPAQLNQSSLLVSPLYGAVYKGDGRVEKLNSSFGYATWDAENQIFMIKDDIGVRAISSVTVEAVGFAQQVYDKRMEAVSANLQAGSIYTTITQNDSYMNTLATVMGTYMTANLNADDAALSNPSIEQKDVINLRDLFEDFISVYDAQFAAMAKMANYQLFLLNNSEAGSTPYREKTAQDIMDSATTEATLKKEKIQIRGLNTAKSDYAKLLDGYAKLVALAEQGSVKWADSGLTNIVNSLMNTGTCTLDGTPVNSIGASNALGYLSGTRSAKITNGVLYNFETLNGTRCDVRGLKVSAKAKRMGVTVPATITVNITTSAEARALFVADLEDYADKLNQGAKGVEVAQDTYGLAVDVWVRTNASNSYLTLEGNVLTKSETVRATGTDINGNTVELFVLTRSGKEEKEDGTTETVSYEVDVYKVVNKDENGQEVETWHDASTHSTITLENGEKPIAKMTELITVIGFEGENRVWEDSSQMSTDATTQGSGSCYVYYADSPEDQARSLKLLESMNVAFVDDSGNLMATAIMDTERFYAENGRVTVPLVLGSESLNIGTDDAGNSIYAITPLVQNEAKRITAIVYLDGTKLTNKDVLAASDIQGKLNIQFGSNVTLSHAEDETLFNATRTVSASIDKTNFKYDESIESGIPMRSTVTVRVDGDEPTAVTGFFIRAISSTQGSREEKMIFQPQADGTWTASYDFTAPGNYVLRSVELDGQTYDLAEKLDVIVEGFTVQSLECTQAVGRHVSIMTAAASSAIDLKLKFASDLREAMPTTVQGRFLRKGDGAAVNISFTYNANSGYWTGQANFISSGEYTLEYLVLNGEYVLLEESMIQTATIYLGMKTAIYTDSPTSFLYIPDDLTENQLNLKMKVKIMDNTGKEMEGLQNVHLYYGMEGSTTNGMDAPLTWDGTYYTCTFPAEVGIYKFKQVTVGSNTITYAIDSPKFQIMSPNPPSFVDTGTDSKTALYYGNRDAKMEATFDYSTTSTIMALIRKELKDANDKVTSSAKYYVIAESPATVDNRTTWSFKLPDTEAQDGYWTMEELYVWNYYTSDGDLIETTLERTNGSEWDYTTQKWIKESDLNFTEDNSCMRIDVTDKEYWKKVIEKVTVRFKEDKSQDFTGNDFLAPYAISGLSVEFVDFQDRKIVDANNNLLVNNVQLIFEYVNNTSSTYGHYTSTGLTNVTEGAVVTVKLTADDTGVRFAQAEDAQLIFAGKYNTTLKYNIGTVSKSETATDPIRKPITNMPMFTVSSNRPYVKFSATNPAEGTTFNVAFNKNNPQKSDVKSLANDIYDEGYSVLCYYKANDDGCNCNGYTASKATAGLYGMGANYESATCTIATKSTATNVVYKFNKSNADANGNVFNEQTFGANGNDRVYLGTDAMATELIVTANGQEYTFVLEKPLKATLEY